MKKFKNKSTEIKNVDESMMTFADLGKVCINAMPQGGLDVTQMRDRLNILSQLDSANGSIELEDSLAATFKGCVTEMKWAVMHNDIVSFVEEVEKI